MAKSPIDMLPDGFEIRKPNLPPEGFILREKTPLIEPDSQSNITKRAKEEFDYAADNGLSLDIAQWDRELYRANEDVTLAFNNDPTALTENSLAVAELIEDVTKRPPNPYEQESFEHGLYERGPITGTEQFANEWFTSKGIVAKLPLASEGFQIWYARESAKAFERINAKRKGVAIDPYAKTGLPQDFASLPEHEQRSAISLSRNQPTAENDKKMLESYFEYLYESEIRGMNDGAKIVQGVSILPKYMIEFAATGGVAEMGSGPAKYAATKLLSKYGVNKTVRHAVTKGVGVVGGGIARGTVGFGHKIAAGTVQARTEIDLGVREAEPIAATIAKQWGDQVIEAVSEESGALIEKPLKAAGAKLLKKMPVLNKLFKGFKEVAPKGKYADFVETFFNKARWNGFIAEYGEERIGTILRGLTGVEDYGIEESNPFIRVYEMLKQDLKNANIELPVLIVPGGVKSIVGGTSSVIDKMTEKGAQEEARRILAEESGFVEAQVESEAEKDKKGDTGPSGEKELQIEPDKPIETPKIKTVVELPPIPKQTIATANTAQDIVNVVKDLMDYVSPRQIDIQRDMEALGLDVPSKQRVSQLESLQRARDEGTDTYEHSLNLAKEINASPRPMETHESVGMTASLIRLKRQYTDQHRKFLAERDDVKKALIDAEKERIETDFESMYTALHKSGSERGRALRSQRYALDKDYSFVSVQQEAKIKKGKALDKKEKKSLQKKTDAYQKTEADLEAKSAEMEKARVTQALRLGSIAKYTGMTQAQKKSELKNLVSKVREMIDEGCNL